jgi:DnaJ family protein C protein 9
MAKDAEPALDAEIPSAEEDLYKILGIAADATPETIKTAYKKSALRNHPGMQSSLHQGNTTF